MTRGAKGCLVAVVMLGAALVVVVAAVLLAGGVPQGTVLQITLAGQIEETADQGWPFGFLFEGTSSLHDMIEAIGRAKTDEQVNGLVTVIRPFSMGVGKIQELRDSIIDFRESGKWAVVYMESAGEFSNGNSTYYLASAFDEISVAPLGDVNLTGLLGATTFLRGTLDKIGVYPDMDSIGKYKNAKDVYTEKKMTAAHREATMMYLEDWFDQIVDGIAAGRGLEPDQVREIIDRGPYTGRDALEVGLIDNLVYHDEFEDSVEELNGGEVNYMEFGKYLDRSPSPGGRRIAVITGVGLIVTGDSFRDPWAGDIMGSATIVDAFQRARKDRTIKAIVFRVDSPGGSPLASDIIWRETQLARGEKPVIVSMGDVAASGGYYVAAGADRIVCQPGTITGSIGVVAGKLVTTGLYEWLGLNREKLQVGDHATYYYTGERYSDEEREIYWRFMKKIYGEFTQKVADGRGMEVGAVDSIGQGHVWTGTRALELGLVDEIGGLRTAIEVAKEVAGIPADEEVRIVHLPKERGFFERLFRAGDRSSMSRVTLPSGIRTAVRDLARLALLESEPVWLLAPLPVAP